jgi:predicted glycosyltransferase
MSLQELIVMRGNLIRTALESFQPDVFIVDNVPRGAVRELDPALQALRQSGRTQCVLGLRDILDTPAVVKREWGTAANYDAIRQYFDQIWVFGDPAVYDPVAEYSFPADIAPKVRYAGYLDQRARLNLDDVSKQDPLAGLNLPDGKLALCMVGGGQDGSRVAEAFAQADLPHSTNGVVVTGPFMPEETQNRLRGFAESNPRLRILDFIQEPGFLMQRADSVVAMGGYNTVCEVLSHNKRALIVPRVRPREEQHIRARRLSDLGKIDMLHPDCLSPARLSVWLADKQAKPSSDFTIDQNGLERLPRLLDDLLTPTVAWSTDRAYGEESQYAAL